MYLYLTNISVYLYIYKAFPWWIMKGKWCTASIIMSIFKTVLQSIIFDLEKLSWRFWDNFHDFLYCWFPRATLLAQKRGGWKRELYQSRLLGCKMPPLHWLLPNRGQIFLPLMTSKNNPVDCSCLGVRSWNSEVADISCPLSVRLLL